MELIVSDGVPPSPARVDGGSPQAPFRIAAVQTRWHEDPEEHANALLDGIAMAAEHGARLVCLQELTLSPYFAISPDADVDPEPLTGGATFAFAARAAAQHGVFVHASLFEQADADDPLGFNTAIVVSPEGDLVARTRKLHIPVTAGYHEDAFFRAGPPGVDAFPVTELGGARLGFPTCWDQWFPELARAYALQGAGVLVFPTAIGSEPDFPDFDTQPLWQQVIVGSGIANGTFMVAVNRVGTETAGATSITFYGSSFVSDPYGRILVQAPRDGDAVLVADLDLQQRDDWLTLFPFLSTRRPDAYGSLT